MFHRKVLYAVCLSFCVVMFNGCATLSNAPAIAPEELEKEAGYAIKNVNIVPVTSNNAVIENATVVIDGERMLLINQPVSDGVKIIDGSGKWLNPDLIDMHVHNLADIDFGSNCPAKGAAHFTDTQDFMLLYVTNGVTTAF